MIEKKINIDSVYLSSYDMSSSSDLIIAGYPTFSLENDYDQTIINLIFQQEDYIVEKRRYSAKNRLIWGEAYLKEKGSYTFRGFIQRAGICRRRMEIFGHSIKRARKDFNRAKKNPELKYTFEFPMSSVSFETYFAEIKRIIRNGIIHHEELFYNLQVALISSGLGIHGQEFSSLLYTVLSAVDENEIVEYDMSDIINYGWISKRTASSIRKNIEIEKIIVLTEGKTDTEFISESLKRLYPHLFAYYQFIDLKKFNVEANASALVQMTKSFAASNVKHPIVVLFDNDTAGIIEMKRLLKHEMPKNIKILRLPDIRIANNYPVLQNSDLIEMNVNGLACSIEMYLGEERLKRDGRYIPMILKEYADNTKSFHWPTNEKGAIQKRFRQSLTEENWGEMNEMHMLLNIIFNAYRDCE
jgi:5S rRNA maturation endonuclease (ribonuclease M5)